MLIFSILLLSGAFGFSATPVFAKDIPTTVTIKPSLSLSIPASTVTLTLDPTTTPFTSSSVDITVGTNNPTGYWLTMSSTGTNSTSLINAVDDSKTIPTLSSSTSETDFPVNKWGYKVGTDTSSNYLPYTSGVTIGSNSGRVNSDTTTLNIASKVDYLTTPGDYKQTFTFTALPHVTQYYMQDLLATPGLAAEVCNEEAPSIVIDKRDEQAYMIQRLPDHKCWMLDNLNLDLTNKDVVDGLTTTNTNVDAASLKSLREGNRTDCDESDCSQYATSGLELSNWGNSLGNSSNAPKVNKSGTCSTTGSWPCTYNGDYNNNVALSTLTPEQSNFGLGSGKIGILYNYCAVSAGNYCYNNSVSPTSDTNSEYDICPANWRLPRGGSSGEFQNLCTQIRSADCDEGDSEIPATDTNSFQYKFSATFSGFYNGIGNRIGDSGHFWTSSRSNQSRMYSLRVSATFIYAISQTNDRVNGMAARCLLNES